MQNNEQKTSEVNKLNKRQRATMRSLWRQPIDTVIVTDVLSNNYPVVRVCNESKFWLAVILGPRGGMNSKPRYDQLS